MGRGRSVSELVCSGRGREGLQNGPRSRSDSTAGGSRRRRFFRTLLRASSVTCQGSVCNELRARRVSPVGAQPVPRVRAWVMTGVRDQSSDWVQFETQSLSGCTAGLTTQRLSNIVTSFSCEKFLISERYFKVNCFHLKAPDVWITVQEGERIVSAAVSLLREFPGYLSD